LEGKATYEGSGEVGRWDGRECGLPEPFKLFRSRMGSTASKIIIR